MPNRMHDHEVAIGEPLVRRLLDEQFPRFTNQKLTLVEPWGTDNAIWRIGADHVVRLPRVEWAVEQVEREAEWLPKLAPQLSVVLPTPVEIGRPGERYPFPWAIHTWIPGDGARPELLRSAVGFARDLAVTMQELQRCAIDGAPAAGSRARHLADYDIDTRAAIDSAAHLIDAPAATEIWEAGLAASPHADRPSWVHGDLEGNCILRHGRLHGLLDWGLGCVGDPAVDVQVMWSRLFTSESRTVFADALGLDDATIARSRAAAINQACGALPYYLDTYPLIVQRSWDKLAALGVERVHPA